MLRAHPGPRPGRTSRRISLCSSTRFLMFATVMKPMIIKEPSITPSPHPSVTKPSGVLACRQFPNEFSSLRRIRLKEASLRVSGLYVGAISSSYVGYATLLYRPIDRIASHGRRQGYIWRPQTEGRLGSMISQEYSAASEALTRWCARHNKQLSNAVASSLDRR